MQIPAFVWMLEIPGEAKSLPLDCQGNLMPLPAPPGGPQVFPPPPLIIYSFSVVDSLRIALNSEA
jgi:hypothetical protein